MTKNLERGEVERVNLYTVQLQAASELSVHDLAGRRLDSISNDRTREMLIVNKTPLTICPIKLWLSLVAQQASHLGTKVFQKNLIQESKPRQSKQEVASGLPNIIH